MVPPERGFSDVAMKMFLGILMKDPVVTTLNQAYETLSRIGSHLYTIGICPNILTIFVSDNLVTALEVGTDPTVANVFVGHDRCAFMNVSLDVFAKGFLVHSFDGLGNGLAVLLDQNSHGRLVGPTTTDTRSLVGVLVLGLTADVGFIGLNGAAQKALVGLHRVTDTMEHKPSSPVGTKAEIALKLESGKALLAGADQVEGEYPLVEWHLATLHHSSDGDGVLLPTVVALDSALTMGLAA